MTPPPDLPDDDGQCVGVCSGCPVDCPLLGQRREAPEWTHRLLTAFLTGQPLNFGTATPPPDIRSRLDHALHTGALQGVPA